MPSIQGMCCEPFLLPEKLTVSEGNRQGNKGLYCVCNLPALLSRTCSQHTESHRLKGPAAVPVVAKAGAPTGLVLLDLYPQAALVTVPKVFLLEGVTLCIQTARYRLQNTITSILCVPSRRRLGECQFFSVWMGQWGLRDKSHS